MSRLDRAAAAVVRVLRLLRVAGEPGHATPGVLARGLATILRAVLGPCERLTLASAAVMALNDENAAELDDAALLRELRGLERRRGQAGRDRVDHRPGQHDDRAVAALGAIVAAHRASARPAFTANQLVGTASAFAPSSHISGTTRHATA